MFSKPSGQSLFRSILPCLEKWKRTRENGNGERREVENKAHTTTSTTTIRYSSFIFLPLFWGFKRIASQSTVHWKLLAIALQEMRLFLQPLLLFNDMEREICRRWNRGRAIDLITGFTVFHYSIFDQKCSHKL